jgi:hypothetical protein
MIPEMFPGMIFEDYTGPCFWRKDTVSRQDLRLEMEIAYFKTMSKIVQFGRIIHAHGPPTLAKILPIHTIVQEVI